LGLTPKIPHYLYAKFQSLKKIPISETLLVLSISDKEYSTYIILETLAGVYGGKMEKTV
jgi:hypothetical protein